MASSVAMDGTAVTALGSVLQCVQRAAELSGRGPQQIRVVVVSKPKPVSIIRQVYDADHRCFGENYVQELVDKAPHLPMDIEWHFIGNLQSKKVKPLLRSASRWPKTEVEALIRLRKELEMKYQENGPKGILWEEISAAMRGLGYNRSSKRCKEKWENINKYFKKVKYSNKKRPEDSKTCPYFHQLDALYKEKDKTMSNNFDINSQMEPLMVEPEQQWPPLPFQANQMMGNLQRINVEEDQEEDEGSSSTDVED